MTGPWLQVFIVTASIGLVTLTALLPTSWGWRAISAATALAILGLSFFDYRMWHLLDRFSQWSLAVTATLVLLEAILVSFDRTAVAGRSPGRLLVALSTASGSSLGTFGGIAAGAAFNFLILFLVPNQTPLSYLYQLSFASLLVASIVLVLAYFHWLGRLAFWFLKQNIRARHDHVRADHAIASGKNALSSFFEARPYQAWNSRYMHRRLAETPYEELVP